MENYTTEVRPGDRHAGRSSSRHCPRASEQSETEPPKNLEAERGALGSILLENSVIDEVSNILTADYFYLDAHQRIYAAILRLHESGIHGFDAVTVGDALKQQNELQDIGGYDYLTELLESVPHAAHAKYYAQAIADSYLYRQFIAGISDIWRSALVKTSTADGLLDATESLAVKIRALRAKRPSDLDILNLSDVEAKTVDWFWPERFPAAMLSILVGEPGAGKTQLACDMTSAATTGRRWPDGSGYARQGRVLWLCAEDALEYTMRPRLDAAGADPKLVDFVRGVLIVTKESGKKSSRALRLDLDVPRLERYLLDHPDTALIVADPVTEIMGPIDSHKNAEVRTVLAPLCAAAEKYGVAIIGLSHFSKGLGQRALSRVMGSLAFVAVARAVWAVVPDKDDEDRRLLLPVKMNIAKRPDGLAFRITDSGLVWDEGSVHTSVDDALDRSHGTDGDGDSVSKLTQAKDWLKQRLANGQQVESDDLEAEAKAAGISRATHLRSKKELKDECELRSEKERGVKNGRWFISIPIQVAHVGCLDNVESLESLESLQTEAPQHTQHTQETQHTQDTHIGSSGKTLVAHDDELCSSSDWWLASTGLRYCKTCKPPLHPDLAIDEGTGP